MKRLEFDVKHGHYAHPDGRWVTYDDAIALARRVAYRAIKWHIHRELPATNPKAEDEAINAIIAEAEKS